jgi:cadmium resistance protein CadD (predicted permease)
MLDSLVSFIATNIDDIIVLMLFFSRLNPNFRPRHIILGQYIGFSLIILASLPGLLGGLIIPTTWIGLLGFLPIVIGIKQLMNADTAVLGKLRYSFGARRTYWQRSPCTSSLRERL